MLNLQRIVGGLSVQRRQDSIGIFRKVQVRIIADSSLKNQKASQEFTKSFSPLMIVLTTIKGSCAWDFNETRCSIPNFLSIEMGRR